MNYQTIGEIYDANAKIKEKLKARIADLSEAQLDLRGDNNGWTIRQIIEHLAVTENGLATVCSRLLQKAVEENVSNDGKANISAEFLNSLKERGDRRTFKFNAPERVQPTNNFSVADSLSKMDESAVILQQIRPGLESIDTQKHKFPHPAFGDMSATEWLALIGGHEMRHMDQIAEILATN